MNSKEKGNLLEDIIEHLCSGVKGAKVSKNAGILGTMSGKKREIDVLIKGQIGMFPVSVIIEAKNYNKPVGIEKIESLKSKLDDVCGDLGVIVCPKGFTKAARSLAISNGIKLFEVVDPKLGNNKLFIPLRCIMPNMAGYSLKVIHRTIGEFSISQDISRWRFHIGNDLLNSQQLATHAWNTGMIPQEAGNHTAIFNAMTMSDAEDPKYLQYCEIEVHIKVIEKFYLKLIPASFLRDSMTDKAHFNLDIYLASRDADMEKAGWKEFSSFEEMDKVAEVKDQPEGIEGLIIKPSYAYINHEQQ
jgi:hypothetical protein